MAPTSDDYSAAKKVALLVGWKVAHLVGSMVVAMAVKLVARSVD